MTYVDCEIFNGFVCLIPIPLYNVTLNRVFFRLAALFVVAIARYDSSSPLQGAYRLASRYRYAGERHVARNPALPLPGEKIHRFHCHVIKGDWYKR